MNEIPEPPISHPLPMQLFPMPETIGEIAYYVESKKRAIAEEIKLWLDGKEIVDPGIVDAKTRKMIASTKKVSHEGKFFLVAVGHKGVFVQREFYTRAEALNEARNLWVNEGFLAVEAFRYRVTEKGLRLETIYHGLRDF